MGDLEIATFCPICPGWEPNLPERTVWQGKRSGQMAEQSSPTARARARHAGFKPPVTEAAARSDATLSRITPP